MCCYHCDQLRHIQKLSQKRCKGKDSIGLTPDQMYGINARLNAKTSSAVIDSGCACRSWTNELVKVTTMDCDTRVSCGARVVQLCMNTRRSAEVDVLVIR